MLVLLCRPATVKLDTFPGEVSASLFPPSYIANLCLFYFIMIKTQYSRIVRALSIMADQSRILEMTIFFKLCQPSLCLSYAFITALSDPIFINVYIHVSTVTDLSVKCYIPSLMLSTCYKYEHHDCGYWAAFCKDTSHWNICLHSKWLLLIGDRHTSCSCCYIL